MASQTNPFQALIAFIERQLAEGGATVTESAQLKEPSGAQREVDVLIEADINGHPIRVAIECRDHQTKQDVTWIDALIGKYQNLDVSQVVAVSSSGFTTNAIEKAATHRIRTLSLEEALESDWPKDLIRPFIRILAERHALTNAMLRFGNGRSSFQGDDLLNAPAYDGLGNQVASVRDLVLELYQHSVDAAIREVLAPRAEAIMREGHTDSFSIQIPFQGGGRFVREPNGVLNEILEVICVVQVTPVLLPAETKHFFYNRTQVTVGKLDLDAGKRLQFAVVQLPKTAERFRLAYTNVAKRTPPSREPKE